jgi:diguanylate cyclase (GGDEF)-like protein
MTLDMRTIVVMLLVSAVLMTVTLAAGIRAGRGGGFAKWSLGLGLFALGWLLVTLRGALPDLVAVAAADALLLAGLCLQLAAVIEFGGRPAPRLLWIAPGPLLFAALAPMLSRYAALTLVASLAYSAALAATATVALRQDAAARWMLAAAYFAGALMLPVRAIDIWLKPQAHPDMFAASPLHTATFIALFAMTVVASIAFLLMHRERAEAELRHLAAFDALTEVFNRRAFFEIAERELARARRARLDCAVLMLDLDHFKRVNDAFGHAAGDRVLREFAAAVKAAVRAEDLVGRYGGEEFCVLLPGAAIDTALRTAERIRAAVERRPLGGLPRATTVSIGVAACEPLAPEALDACLARADDALYRAKAAGRNRVAGPMPVPRATFDADQATSRIAA